MAGILVAAGCLLSALLYRFASNNFFCWGLLLWGAVFALAAALFRGMPRIIAANLAGVAAVFLFFELYFCGSLSPLGLFPHTHFGTEYNTPPNYQRRGGPLGYGPVPGVVVTSKKIAAGAVIYDVVYTIDENGFRFTPPLAKASPAVLFLGDSITFGHGVNDGEAFPAVFQAESGLKAINLAYGGYGPHQMLRLLEIGGERSATARYRPIQAYYLFWPGHIQRAAGDSYWDPDGPRYELNSDGVLSYQGPWRSRRAASAIRLLAQSALLRWGWSHWTQSSAWESSRDVERFAAIIVELRRVFKDRYGGDLQVLIQDRRASHLHRPIVELLARRGVPVLRLSEVVPEIARPELYLLRDGHPGPVVHRAIGRYLARRTVGKNSAP